VDQNVYNSAAFLQDEIWLANPLLLVIGGRLDHHSNFGTEFSPRLGATYSVTENFRLKGAYGEGFRAPSIYELFGHRDTPKNLLIPNHSLTAETSRGYEFTAEGKAGLLSSRVTFFRNEIKDMINTVQIGLDTLSQSGGGGGGGKSGGSKSVQTRPIFKYENVDRATVQGVELAASLELPVGLTISDEATLLDTKDENTGRELFNKPDFNNVVKLAYAHEKLGLNANFRIISTGSQWLSLTEKVDSYTVCNLYLSKKMAANFKLYGGVNNVFNANPYFPHFEGTGTYFYLGISADYR
jgi:outer membrane receptor for ferrienterochelin and colicins